MTKAAFEVIESEAGRNKTHTTTQTGCKMEIKVTRLTCRNIYIYPVYLQNYADLDKNFLLGTINALDRLTGIHHYGAVSLNTQRWM